MNELDNLISILSQSRYQKVLISLLIIILPILTITSDIVIIQTLEINLLAEPVKILLMLKIGILMALNGTVAFHNYEVRKRNVGKATILGTVVGFFTTTCPICQPIWLVWLGFGSATAFLAEISIYVGLASLILLLVSLHYSLKTKCEGNKNGKNN